MESPNVARSLYVYKSLPATHRQIDKQFSLLESSELKSWHNLTVDYPVPVKMAIDRGSPSSPAYARI